MTKNKSNINWYFILAGVLALYVGLSNNQTRKQTDLRIITVELSKDIINVKGRRSSIDYKFWTKECRNQFTILNGSISRGKHEAISNLKSGQKVDVFITTTDYDKLGNKNEDIVIRGISLNGNSLMSQEEFFNNRKTYKIRLMIFSVFTGLMLLLNGLTKISNKINYLIIGTFVGVIILMRIFEFRIY